MKQRFLLEVDRPEGDPLDARWIQVAIEQFGSHMIKRGDLLVTEFNSEDLLYAAKLQEGDPKSPLMLFKDDPGLKSPYFAVVKLKDGV